MLGIAADLVVFLHLLFVLFIVGGGVAIFLSLFIQWPPLQSMARNKPFRIVHMSAIAFVTLESVLGVLCPLTEIEYFLRHRAGQYTGNTIPFMSRLVRSILYYDFPWWVFTATYAAFTAGIIILYFVSPPRSGNSKKGE